MLNQCTDCKTQESRWICKSRSANATYCPDYKPFHEPHRQNILSPIISRKECNECATDSKCKSARGPFAIKAERAGKLTCFIPPKTKNFKFPDLISSLRIENPDNPAIRFFAKRV